MDKKQTFKEMVAELAAIGKEFFASEVKEVKFADYKAEDGSIVRTDTEEVAVGSKLQVITPEGIMDVPAEVTELVVMVNDVPTKLILEQGVVKEMQQQGTPEQPAPVEEMETKGGEFDAKFAELTDRIAKLEEALGLANQAMETANQTIASNTATIASQNELTKKLFAAIEKMADAPSVAPISKANEKVNSVSNLDDFRNKYFNY